MQKSLRKIWFTDDGRRMNDHQSWKNLKKFKGTPRMIYWYPCVPNLTLVRSTTSHFQDICYSFPIGHCAKCQSFWKKKWDWNVKIHISKFYENYHREDVENVWFNINQKLWEGLRFEIVTPIGLHINEYFHPLKIEIWIAKFTEWPQN